LQESKKKLQQKFWTNSENDKNKRAEITLRPYFLLIFRLFSVKISKVKSVENILKNAQKCVDNFVYN
jgi:hypothetical protein